MPAWGWKLLALTFTALAGGFVLLRAPEDHPSFGPTVERAPGLSSEPTTRVGLSAARAPTAGPGDVTEPAQVRTLSVRIAARDQELVSGARVRLAEIDLDDATIWATNRFRGTYLGCRSTEDSDDREAIAEEHPHRVRPAEYWRWVAEGVSGDDGQVVLTLTEGRRYALVAFHPDRGSGVSEVFDWDEKIGPSEGARLYLTEPDTWRGVVVDEQGAPISGATLSFLSEAYLREGHWPLDDLVFLPEGLRPTGPTGELEVHVNGLHFAHEIEVSKPGFVTQRSRRTEDGDLRVVLRRGHRLFGRVVDRSGEAVPHAALKAYSLEGDGLRQAYANAEGRFTFDDAAEGEWTATVRSAAHLERRDVALKVGVPNEIVLEPAGQVRVELFVDPSLGDPKPRWRGGPLAFAGNTVLRSLPPHPADGEYSRWKDLARLIDPETRAGEYVFGRLETGRYQLFLELQNTLAVRDLDVRAGDIQVIRSEDLLATAGALVVSARAPVGAEALRDARLRLEVLDGNGNRVGSVYLGPLATTPTGFEETLFVSTQSPVRLRAHPFIEYADRDLRCWRYASGEVAFDSRTPRGVVELEPEALELARTSSAAAGAVETYPNCSDLEESRHSE